MPISNTTNNKTTSNSNKTSAPAKSANGSAGAKSSLSSKGNGNSSCVCRSKNGTTDLGSDPKTAVPPTESNDPPRSGTATTDTSEVSREEAGPRESVNDLVGGLESWGREERQEGTSGASASSDAETAESTSTEEPTRPALELGEGELLSRSADANPEKVTQLQEMLRGEGLELAVDGKFGPETQNAVREYQQRNNLSVDGIVGPETMGSLNGTRSQQNSDASASTEDTATNPSGEVDPAAPGEQGRLQLANPDMSPQEQYEYYKGIVEANGGRLNADGPTVLGMRGLGVDGAYHDSAQNVGGYNDTFVVLNQGPDGNPSVQTFQGATHANQYSSGQSHGPDASGRTIRGVAQLQPGSYDVDYATGNYQGYGAAYHVKTLNGNGMVPAFRDTNADGMISSSERNAAISGGYQASAILFHNGKRDSPSSIGCQTIIPSQHTAFTNAIGRNGFNYTLVDANNAYMPAS